MEAVHELATALVAVEAEAEAELQSLDPRRRVVDPCRGVRGPLEQRLHGLLRGGAPGFHRTQLVQGGGHHLLKAGELLRHLLHRRLQVIDRSRHLDLVLRGITLLRRQGIDLGKKKFPKSIGSDYQMLYSKIAEEELRLG